MTPLMLVPYSEFSFLKKLGEGTYGKVYSAKNSKGSLYAVKLFKKKYLFDGKQNLTEMEVVDYLSGKYPGKFPGVYGYIIERSHLGIVYELYTSNIEKLMQEDISYSRIYKWMFILLENLHLLHSEKIYHRDIKTTNIIWDSSTDKVTFCDFGSSRRYYDPTNLDGTPDMESVTTKGYIAPEFLKKEEYDFEYMYGLDIWSFGITFLHFITKKCIKEPYVPDLPHEGVKKLLEDSLTIDYKKRPTAAQLLSKHFLFPIKELTPAERKGKLVDRYKLFPIMEKLEMKSRSRDLAVKIHLLLEEKDDFLNKLGSCHISQCYFESPPFSIESVAEMYSFTTAELEIRCRQILISIGLKVFTI